MSILWIGSLNLKSEQDEMHLGKFQLGCGGVQTHSTALSYERKEGIPVGGSL